MGTDQLTFARLSTPGGGLLLVNPFHVAAIPPPATVGLPAWFSPGRKKASP
jgi:hypothetical protein